MAFTNSITIGKGTKSIGNVTLANVGGRIVAKQKITSNSSNTAKQASQRAKFKLAMSYLRQMAYFSRLCFRRSGTYSAFSKFCHSWYDAAPFFADHADTPPQSHLSEWLHSATIQEKLGSDASFILQEGDASDASVEFAFKQGETAASALWYVVFRGDATGIQTYLDGNDEKVNVIFQRVHSLFAPPYTSGGACAVVRGSAPSAIDAYPIYSTLYIDEYGGYTLFVTVGDGSDYASKQDLFSSGWPLLEVGGVRPRLTHRAYSASV